jgi:hypothetical protein
LCLEQALLRTVGCVGFETVRAKVVDANAAAVDTAVRAAFGSGLQATERNACGSLERRVHELADKSGNLLAPQQYRFDADRTEAGDTESGEASAAL